MKGAEAQRAAVILELNALARTRSHREFVTGSWPALNAVVGADEDEPSLRIATVQVAVTAAVAAIDDPSARGAAEILFGSHDRWRALGRRQQDAGRVYRGIGGDAFRRKSPGQPSHQDLVIEALADQLFRRHLPTEERPIPTQNMPASATEHLPSPGQVEVEPNSAGKARSTERGSRLLALAAGVVMTLAVAAAGIGSVGSDDGSDVASSSTNPNAAEDSTPDAADAVAAGVVPDIECDWAGAQLGDMQQQILAAHDQAGGVATMGCPFNELHAWGSGQIVDFRGGERGDAAIVIAANGDAVALPGPAWRAYINHGGSGTPAHLGYPLSAQAPCGHGHVIALEGNGVTPAGMVADSGGTWRVLRGTVWADHECQPNPGDVGQTCLQPGALDDDSPADGASFAPLIEAALEAGDCLSSAVRTDGPLLRYQELVDEWGNRDGVVTVSVNSDAVRLTDAEWDSFLIPSAGLDNVASSELLGLPTAVIDNGDHVEVQLAGSGRLVGLSRDSRLFFLPDIVAEYWDEAGGAAGRLGLPISGVFLDSPQFEQFFERAELRLVSEGTLEEVPFDPPDGPELAPPDVGGIISSDAWDAFVVTDVDELAYVTRADEHACWGSDPNTVLTLYPVRSVYRLVGTTQARCSEAPSFRPLDLNSFCATTHDGGRAEFDEARSEWTCEQADGAIAPVDLEYACHRQHGSSSELLNRQPENHSRWRCVVA